MKKLTNYSLLIFLFSFIAFACSKEDGEVNPKLSLKTTATNEVVIGGFGFSCLTQSEGQWSFTIAPGARYGLSNLQLELLACPEPGTTVELSEGSITGAFIMIQGVAYVLTPIYNSDGSCIGIKGDDFTSFVKFEFGGNQDDLLKQYGGTLYFTLSDGSIVLSGANLIVKTGGKDTKCYRGSIVNCAGCNTTPPRENCSYSQGYFFNSGQGGAEWTSVTVGNKTVLKGEMTLPATTAANRAFFQAATLILSGTDLSLLPADVKAAFDYIVAYYSGLNNGTNLQTAAGKIGSWIDLNHC